MASIGWIDFSRTHRDKVGAALDLLKPDGMVDELGLGSLRDGMANKMFPGISTIQTRAKYFFIIPYILYEFQQLINSGKARGKSASKYLEQREYEIMWQLYEQYKDIKSSGVIGATRPKPMKIVRRPSAIYWNGLNMYNFINSGGLSAEAFLRKAVNGEFESLLSQASGTDEPNDDADAEHDNIFKLKIVPAKNWDKSIRLDLLTDEADFLCNNILSKAKGKLISELLNVPEIWDVFYSSNNFMEFAQAVQPLKIDENIKEEIILAHDFSELMYGAHITYNCLLQENKFGGNFYEDDWNQWIEGLPNNMISYKQFDLDRLLSYSLHTRKSTVAFVKNWLDFVYNSGSDLKRRNALVAEQEFNVKRNKARVRYKKLDDVKEEVWIGFQYLEYRFRNTRTIINDVNSGLKNNVTS